MRRPAAFALGAGVALAAWLLVSNDAARIAAVLLDVSWWIVPVIALHLPQIFLSGLAWGSLLPADRRLPAGVLFCLRFVREAVNALLPVAQLGGDVVRVRLAARRGVPLVDATATGFVDLSVEVATLAAFTLAGVAVLAIHAAPKVGLAMAGGVGLLALTLLGSQRFGVFLLIERLAARRRAGKALEGLNDAALALYRQPRLLVPSVIEHLLSWLAGVAETWVALRAVGVHAAGSTALAIEALGQAARAAGFLIPGAIGVQEGGYVLVCGLFGIPADQALALSLVRRIRELALGLPGLALWRRMERMPE